MDRELFLKAYAKVNLQLDVLGRRPDGFHELAGIMQRISLCDDISIRLSPAPARKAPLINVYFSEPVPHNNTVRKAAELYLGPAAYRVDISVQKYIPSEAGLGGASADAAAVLRGLNALFAGTELEKTEPELYSLGLSVGADVPFCLAGGCRIARGVGELLTPLPVLPMSFVILKGRRGVSTPRLFALTDELYGAENTSHLPQNALNNAVDAINRGDIASLGKHMLNALQPAALTIAPEIAEELELLNRFGALGACMTGSGSAVVGLFEDEKAAQKAIEHLNNTAPDGLFFAACRAI